MGSTPILVKVWFATIKLSLLESCICISNTFSRYVKYLLYIGLPLHTENRSRLSLLVEFITTCYCPFHFLFNANRPLQVLILSLDLPSTCGVSGEMNQHPVRWNNEGRYDLGTSSLQLHDYPPIRGDGNILSFL
ncbi:unnamed protein product [Citrullus colocynthis]|uniref:Uncharacterized protein n=1 Tax=Citrullus colocynthis TaxID=252529 RepID=A0ABP0XYY7_9ROSI